MFSFLLHEQISTIEYLFIAKCFLPAAISCSPKPTQSECNRNPLSTPAIISTTASQTSHLFLLHPGASPHESDTTGLSVNLHSLRVASLHAPVVLVDPGRPKKERISTAANWAASSRCHASDSVAVHGEIFIHQNFEEHTVAPYFIENKEEQQEITNNNENRALCATQQRNEKSQKETY